MSRNVSFPCVLGVLWVVAAVAGQSSTWAEPPKPAGERSLEGARQAQALVDEALHREWYGLADQRAELLRRALELAPDYPQARWHSGYVRLKDQWVHVDQAPEQFRRDSLLNQYRKQRQKSDDTVAGNLAMANWCRQNQAFLLEQAHLTRVTRLAPDHAQAHQRLGNTRVGDQWVGVNDFWRGWANASRAAASVKRFEGDIKLLLKAMQQRGPERSQREAELRGRLSDVEAVPALESCLAYRSADEARLAILLLSSIAEHPASAALARLAVLSPWPEIRRQSAESLQWRPLDDYVPLLLEELSAPIEARLEAVNRDGNMLFRHVMAREEQGQTHVEVFDAVALRRGNAARIATPEGDLRVPREILEAAAQQRLMGQAQGIENQRLAQNQWIATVNRRIFEALALATGTIHDTPQQWWSWWDQENDVSGTKPTTVNYSRREEEYAPDSSIVASMGVATVRHECFIAGTQVWTSRGSEAIESLRVGDLVLSQDPATGHLAYHPVTATTQRPPQMLVRVHTAAGVLEGSGGHPMWVVGRGWVKLRDLQSGMLVHGIHGATPVSQVEIGSFAATYNLVVGGAPTYFVGAEKLLCHDNTARRPSSSIVPGASTAR